MEPNQRIRCFIDSDPPGQPPGAGIEQGERARSVVWMGRGKISGTLVLNWNHIEAVAPYHQDWRLKGKE